MILHSGIVTVWWIFHAFWSCRSESASISWLFLAEFQPSGGFLVQKEVIPGRITIPLLDSSSMRPQEDECWQFADEKSVVTIPGLFTQKDLYRWSILSRFYYTYRITRHEWGGPPWYAIFEGHFASYIQFCAWFAVRIVFPHLARMTTRYEKMCCY
jgi:hypothetical protein